MEIIPISTPSPNNYYRRHPIPPGLIPSPSPHTCKYCSRDIIYSLCKCNVIYNKWSQLFDIRPHRRRTRTVQSYSAGAANVHPVQYPQSASTPYQCCPLLSCFDYSARLRCPGMSWAGPFSPSKLTLHMWGSGPPSNRPTRSLQPTRVTPRTVSRLVQLLLQGSSGDRQTDKPTDRPRYSVCSNRPHLASAAVRYTYVIHRILFQYTRLLVLQTTRV